MRNIHVIMLIILCKLFVSTSYAQLWFITRGLPNQDERAWGVDADNSGNIYWAVEEKCTWPNWYYDIILFKIDSGSSQIWQSTPWGGTFNDIAFIIKENGNKIYLAGRTDTSAALDGRSANALVLNYNADNGNFIWKYEWDQGFGYEEIDGLIVQSDGIYLTGWTKGENSDMDFLVQKIDSVSQLIWSNTWDFNNLCKFDGANGHMVMDENCIYATGHVNRINIGTLDGQGALVCFSRNNGEYLWHITWGGSLYDDALGLAMSSDSMLYVVGYTGSYGKGSQIYLNKYSRNGQLIWNNIWGGNVAEDARGIVTDGDSIIYVAGATSSYGHSIGDYDIFILKYNSAGTLIDSLIWGGSHKESAHDLIMSSSYLYVTGETYSFGNAQSDGNHADGLLLKVNGRTMQAPDTTMTSVADTYKSLKEYFIYQNYPNPFNPVTRIKYAIPVDSKVKIAVYNLLGEEVKEIVNQNVSAGYNEIEFNASDLSSGIYLYRIEEKEISGGKVFRSTKKMMVIK